MPLSRFPQQRIWYAETSCPMDDSVEVELEPEDEGYPGVWRDPPCDYSLRWMFICPLGVDHCEGGGWLNVEGLIDHLDGKDCW